MNSNLLSKQFSFKELALLAFSLALFLFAGLLNTRIEKPNIQISKQDSALNIQSGILTSLHAGHKRFITSILWIQTLLEADEQHYEKRDLNSWMFLRFLNISLLDPYFYENYLYGGQLLGIIKDDLEGAEYLYTRGLKYFPNDYSLNFNSGFTLYFEMDRLAAGLARFKKIQNNPRTPPMIQFLIKKLEFQTTRDFDSALSFLSYNLSIANDDRIKEKIKRDFYSLKAERDLECLNNNHSRCETRDANGEPYFYSGKKWNSIQNFPPYKIFKKKKTD
jgi:hypothetical protein